MKVIASHNGLNATRIVYELLKKGVDTLDACVRGVTTIEDDPNDFTVGYGGLPNEEGEVELDAAVMHGPTHRTGAVAGVRGIRHVSRLAQLVMEQTDHQMIVGEGAVRLALANGFVRENLLTDQARRVWLYWLRTRSNRDNWLPPAGPDFDEELMRYFPRPTGTVHLAAINDQGDMSCVTSTSGLAFKLPGRVGDTPIVGAGLFLDNDVGSCGCTGRGEAATSHSVSAVAVELMRRGASPQEAGLEMLRRVAAKTPQRLLDDAGKPRFHLHLHLLAKDGGYGCASLQPDRKFAVTDERGTRLEDAVTPD
jgi:N4-(beta-N-acetylglucosaminyl)-L-asparaginase